MQKLQDQWEMYPQRTIHSRLSRFPCFLEYLRKVKLTDTKRATLKPEATNGGIFTLSNNAFVILVMSLFQCCFFCLCRRVFLYPNGNKKSGVKGHISLYLAMSETNHLPLCWEVNVSFKFLVYDQIRDKYLTLQGKLFLVKVSQS